MLMPNAPAANVSLKYGARAAVHAPTSACASGNEAIAMAIDLIRLGRADVVLAGGTEAAIHPLPMAAFANMMALSKTGSEEGGDPTTVSRPWDTARDGFVLGEGGAVLILESEEHARARGAKIYAEVLGAGISNDAHDIAQPDPEGRGGTRAIKMALREGDVDPATVVHVNAHATSTPKGDIAEGLMLHAVLGDARRPLRGHEHQVDDRPPPRRRRRPRGRRDRDGAARPGEPADDQPRRQGPRGRPRHPDVAARPARGRHRRAQQLLRLRWRQRRRGLRQRCWSTT